MFMGIVNNVPVIAHTDHFTSQDLKILSGSTGINVVLLVQAFLTLGSC